MSYQHLIERFGAIPANHVSPVMFPVKLRDVFIDAGVTADHKPIEGYKAVYREDTGKVLAVHTDAYKLVPHEEVFETFDEAIDASGLDKTDMRIFDDMSHEGARAFRQYLFPAHRIEMPGQDVSSLRIIAVNSYDGSSGAIFRAGAYRFVCANMAILGKDAISLSLRHTKGFDLDKIAKGVLSAAERFEEASQNWPIWREVPVGDEKAMAVFNAIPQSNKALVEHLTTEWVKAKLTAGETLWTLYNVLTAWATHTLSRSNNAAYRLKREEQVARAIDSKPWAELLEAA